MHPYIQLYMFFCLFVCIHVCIHSCGSISHVCMLAYMTQLNFDVLKTRTNVPRDLTKAELWDMLQQQQARLESHDEEMTNFSARIPKSLAQSIRSAAHIQGRKVQDVTAEALTLWLSTQEN